MGEFVPINNLDAALLALKRSTAATPEFYRQLADAELWFLVRYHPELEGETILIQRGLPFPFITLEDDTGQLVPLFSSHERLEEGLENGNGPAHKYLASSMPARQVLEILGAMELRAIINKSCLTGSVVIPPDLMRGLADGTALKPCEWQGPKMEKVLKRLNPADYPTNLIQPVFEFLRCHPNFRLSWIFGPSRKGGAPAKPIYQFAILMEPYDETLFHDFNLVVQAAKGKDYEVELALLDETDAVEIAKLFRQSQPFFVAADYGSEPGRQTG